MEYLRLGVHHFIFCPWLCFTGGIVYSSAHFGAGSGPIFLDDVQCTSSASKLLECYSRPILSHNCLHSDDAGVGCEGITTILTDTVIKYLLPC